MFSSIVVEFKLTLSQVEFYNSKEFPVGGGGVVL